MNLERQKNQVEGVTDFLRTDGKRLVIREGKE